MSILLVLLTIIYVVFGLWLYIGWHRLRVFSLEKFFKTSTKISVIIAARNEAENIIKLIAALKNQAYPQDLYEVIIINDHSTDDTFDLAQGHILPHWKVLSLNADKATNSYKKKAIAYGISEAIGQLIVTTDADCEMGPNWLLTIANYYESTGSAFISSPVIFQNEKNWFEKVQTLEFGYLIGMGAACIANNKPITCNGANLAYTREAFNAVGGFSGIDHLASGDDELLLHKIHATGKYKIGFLKAEEAIVYTSAKQTVSEFIKQRHRWSSKSRKYKSNWIIATVVGVFLLNFLMIYYTAAIFINSEPMPFFGWCMLFKFMADAVIMYRISEFFDKKHLWYYIPLTFVLYPFYICTVGLIGFIGGKYEWKGRSVN